ncbi:MAG: hypothetical protein ACK5M7_01180 [Draconibacterium sp.]
MNKLLIVIAILFFVSGNKHENTIRTFYFNSVSGNDANDGLTSESAWKSFTNLSKTDLQPGTKIMLASGSIFQGGIGAGECFGNHRSPG